MLATCELHDCYITAELLESPEAWKNYFVHPCMSGTSAIKMKLNVIMKCIADDIIGN